MEPKEMNFDECFDLYNQKQKDDTVSGKDINKMEDPTTYLGNDIKEGDRLLFAFIVKGFDNETEIFDLNLDLIKLVDSEKEEYENDFHIFEIGDNAMPTIVNKDNYEDFKSYFNNEH